VGARTDRTDRTDRTHRTDRTDGTCECPISLICPIACEVEWQDAPAIATQRGLVRGVQRFDLPDSVEPRESRGDSAAVFVPAQQAGDQVERDDIQAGKLALNAAREGVDENPFRTVRELAQPGAMGGGVALELCRHRDHRDASGDARIGRVRRGGDEGRLGGQTEGLQDAAATGEVAEAAADGVVEDHRPRERSSARRM
jgi:hypothetical protein